MCSFCQNSKCKEEFSQNLKEVFKIVGEMKVLNSVFEKYGDFIFFPISVFVMNHENGDFP